MKYKTKIALWAHLVVLFVILLNLGSIIGAIVASEVALKISFGAIAGFLFLINAILLVPAWLNNYCLLNENELKLISGFIFKETIDRKSIIGVKETRNPLSSPYAFTLDRIEVSYYKKDGKESFALIAPKHKQDFLQQLNEKTQSGEM